MYCNQHHCSLNILGNLKPYILLWYNLSVYDIIVITMYFMGPFKISKREVPRGVRNSKVRRQDKFRRDWSRHYHKCKSQSGTGPGVRRSKRPLLACRTRCICSMETLHNKVKSHSVIRSRSVMVKNWCNVLSMEDVTVCGHHPEYHILFGRGGPHI